MHRLRIKHTHTSDYEILIEPGLFARCREIIQQQVPSDRYYVITVPPVKEHYLKLLKEQFVRNEIKLTVKVIKDGERSKCQATITTILDFLSTHHANRHSVLLALGGGVVGDITGYAASIYMRGIPYIQLPTSLIAQIDSSVGGKTGINTFHGKNLVGTFYQPSLVIIDPIVLSTLPEEEYCNGLAEAVKYGLLDKTIFEFMEHNIDEIQTRNSTCLLQLIVYCCRHKAKVVSHDLLEQHLRASLNLGHTVGHALEKITNYNYFRHGEAIAWGILAASFLAQQRKFIDSATLNRISNMLASFNLFKPLRKFSFSTLLDIMHHDKKKSTDFLTFVLPVSIGKIQICDDIKEEELLLALDYIKKRGTVQ
ncbi:MAG: 3-dehydroquinate synthase [Candidatus Fischerbacteria bacterium RBG_13_37_8]|uniref:3-dehydroquinate synthase n=1 Tax=Candidatus Fischerbacteria bacterium RBG_13_37_8 TaxID=1817863 RepID=A0A1F5VNV6_9BACT|nr:MAG: 3-dehydroquinate synthase [Candidatus Fischerbacteria bacterium RBG_13_37_8]